MERGEGKSKSQFGLIPPKLLSKLLKEWKKGHNYDPKNLPELQEGVLE